MPFIQLQRLHAVTRFDGLLEPPKCTGTTWSIVMMTLFLGPPVHPQYRHVNPSRRCTASRNAAGTAARFEGSGTFFPRVATGASIAAAGWPGQPAVSVDVTGDRRARLAPPTANARRSATS